MRYLETPSDVIDALGGNIAAGALTGTDPKTVSRWRKAPHLPSKTYYILIAALKDVGASAPVSLWGMVGTRSSELAS